MRYGETVRPMKVSLRHQIPQKYLQFETKSYALQQNYKIYINKNPSSILYKVWNQDYALMMKPVQNTSMSQQLPV